MAGYGEFGRRLPSELRLWSCVVVICPPAFAPDAGLGQRRQQRPQFIPQPAIEALDAGILHFTWRDVVPCDAALVGQGGVASELAAIVADHHLRLVTLDHKPVQFPRHRGAGERSIGRQTLAGAVVDHGQDAEVVAVRKLIRHKAEGSAVVRRHRRAAWATAFRLAVGVTISFSRAPSAPHCPAWRRPATASAACSRPPATSAAWPPRPPAAELRLPFLDAAIADAMLAAPIGDRNAGLMLLQNPDDLLFRKAAALVLVSARTNCTLIKPAGQGQRPFVESSCAFCLLWDVLVVQCGPTGRPLIDPTCYRCQRIYSRIGICVGALCRGVIAIFTHHHRTSKC